MLALHVGGATIDDKTLTWLIYATFFYHIIYKINKVKICHVYMYVEAPSHSIDSSLFKS